MLTLSLGCVAFSTLLLATGISLGIALLPNGAETYSWLYDHWIGLLTAALANSIFQGLWVYLWSFKSGELLALGGNSGNVVYDVSPERLSFGLQSCLTSLRSSRQFFIGRPLNPTPPGFPSFDIKSFNELRPGMILWLILNISCLCQQAVKLGGFSQVTDSMWLVLASQAFYIVDALWNEPLILSTMDITTDGFGFMLSVGDLVWVPFTYGLQARYLAFHPVRLGTVGVLAILAVQLVGAYIFRVSNSDKAAFRSGKNPKSELGNQRYMIWEG